MDFQNNNTLITEQDTIQNESSPIFNLSKKDTIFSIFAVIISVFSAIFGIFGGFALGYSISLVFMNAIFISYFSKGNKSIFSSIIYGVFSLLNSAVFVFTTNLLLIYYFLTKIYQNSTNLVLRNRRKEAFCLSILYFNVFII